MSNEKQLKQEIHRLNQQLKRVQEQIQAMGHENKKALLEANTKLDFQTRKAQEYVQKYKSALQYKNQEQTVKQLDEQLRDKEDEIIRLMRLDNQKSHEIQQLFEENEQLKKQNSRLSSDLDQIKQAALNAIVDKDTTISQLTQKLEEYENSDNLNHMKALMIQLQEKSSQLEQKLETNKEQYVAIIDSKDEQINELHEKIHLLKQKNDEKIVKLQQEIADYERHIQDITAERDHEQNFEQKYYHTEQKLRRTEKKVLQFEEQYLVQRKQLIEAIEKLQQQKENLKHESTDLKDARSKVAHFQKMTEHIKSQWDEQKQKYQKTLVENTKKITHLESEKKLISDNLKIKVQEIQRLKFQLQQKSRTQEPQLQGSSPSKSKISSQDQASLIEKLKKQNKDLQEANETLKKKVQQQTKQLQQSRHKLLQARSSDSSAETNKLKRQMEDITSYLKKVQNDMLMKKITHAQDENFWSIKQKKYKQEIQNLNKKYKKQNSQLLQRIDRMKRLIPKDKKTDYYQSGFK